MLQHVSSKIFNHTTTSRQPFSNFTGFQFIREFTSRSASSFLTYIRGLHHSICLLWLGLLLALPSCPGKVWGLPPKKTSFAPAHVCSLEIGRSRSMVHSLEHPSWIDLSLNNSQPIQDETQNVPFLAELWLVHHCPYQRALEKDVIFYFVRALNAICIVQQYNLVIYDYTHLFPGSSTFFTAV